MPHPTPRLACADFSFPLLPHGTALDLIAALRIPAVDIGLFEGRGHVQPSSELVRVESSARRLRRKLSDRGLELADVFLIPGKSFGELAPNHPESSVRRKAREQFRRVVDFALAAGGRHVGALPGIGWEGEARETSLRRSSEELSWRAEYASSRNVIFSVEPHIGSITPTPRSVMRLLAMTPGLTLTLDYGHFTRQGIADSRVEPLVAHASHFHCRGARKGRLQTSFKSSTINYSRVLAAMRRERYRGYIALEYVWSEWERCNENDNLGETILYRDFFNDAAR